MVNPALDVQHMNNIAMNALHNAIDVTFRQMLGVGIELDPVFVEQVAVEAGPTIAGVIGWVGDWRGIGIFSCKPESACTLANLMLGTASPSLCEDSLDAMAEIANIIFGSVKTEIETITSGHSLGTPSVVYRMGKDVRRPGESFHVTPVRLGAHTFYVKMQFGRASEQQDFSRLHSF